MNKSKLIFFLVVISINAFSQVKVSVQKINNKYIFYDNEPSSKYQVSFSFETTYNFNPCPKISSIGTQIIDGAMKEAGFQNKLFDAVIIGGGSRVLAIKFDDTNSDNSLGIQKIESESGIYKFILCDPAIEYTPIVKVTSYAIDELGNCLLIDGRFASITRIANRWCKKNKSGYNGIILGDDYNHLTILIK